MTEALERAAEATTGLTFLDAHERASTLSFAALLAQAKDVASALSELGLRRGDRVAIILPTGEDFLRAFFGAQRLGAVPVPLYPPARLGRMSEYSALVAKLLDATGAALVLTDRKTSLLLGEAVAGAKGSPRCLAVSELPRGLAEVAADVRPDDLGLIQFSSGSTSTPRPVALTHGNLVSQLAAIEHGLGFDGGNDCGVTWLPLYHDMGLIGALCSGVYSAAPRILIGPEVFLARPAIWLRAISRYRASVSAAPNFAYGLCVKRVKDSDLEGVDLSSWRIALNGAEPVSAETCRAFAQAFARYGFAASAMRPVYGLAESSLAVTFTRGSASLAVLGVDHLALATRGQVQPGSREIVSVGAAVPGAEIEVRDDAGAIQAEACVGRVFTRGPSVMRAYFDNPAATAGALVDGWLDTGDLGFVKDGELFINGRAKDVVIIRGANHTAQEFEEHAHVVPGVRRGCAVALGFLPADATDEQLLILLEKGEGADDELASKVTRAVLDATGIKPHTVVVLERGTLPRTSSGKLRRAEALRRFLEDTLDAPERVSTVTLGRVMALSLLGHLKARARRALRPSATER